MIKGYLQLMWFHRSRPTLTANRESSITLTILYKFDFDC